MCLLDESWWHVPFHELVFCGLYSIPPHLENTDTYLSKYKSSISYLIYSISRM